MDSTGFWQLRALGEYARTGSGKHVPAQGSTQSAHQLSYNSIIAKVRCATREHDPPCRGNQCLFPPPAGNAATLPASFRKLRARRLCSSGAIANARSYQRIEASGNSFSTKQVASQVYACKMCGKSTPVS